MGNKQSDAGARDFFFGIGGILEKGANTAISTLTLPQQLMKSATDFISSPMGSLMIPIVAIGGLYVITQIKK
jgi:hypothetical protein